MVDRSKEVKISPLKVLVMREFVEVFPEELSSLPTEQEILFEIDLLPERKETSNVAARTTR